MTGNVRYLARIFLGASLSTVCAFPAVSQDRDAGGARSTFTTSLGIEGGRNFDLTPGNSDTETRATGTLGYSYRKATRRTELSFDAAIAPEKGQSRVFPTLDLRLNHAGARSKLDFGVSYGEAKVTDQNLGFNSDTGAVIQYDGTGTRILRQYSAGIEGGIDMPFGYTLRADHSRISYRGDTLGDDYTPSKTTRIQGGLRADVSSMTSLTLDADHMDYRAENTTKTHRINKTISIGVDQRIDAVNRFGLSIGRESVQTDRTTENKKRTATVFGATFDHDYALGTSGLGYERYLTENGIRDDVVLRHTRETTLGKFSGNIGASFADAGKTNWIGGVTYDTTLLRNKMSISYTRAVRTNDDGDDVVVSRLSGRISHDFSDWNGLDFGLMASSTKDTGDNNTRVDASVTYRHSLTRDITLQAGVRMGLSKRTNRENADSQSLFVNVTRQVTFLH